MEAIAETAEQLCARHIPAAATAARIASTPPLNPDAQLHYIFVRNRLAAFTA